MNTRTCDAQEAYDEATRTCDAQEAYDEASVGQKRRPAEDEDACMLYTNKRPSLRDEDDTSEMRDLLSGDLEALLNEPQQNVMQEVEEQWRGPLTGNIEGLIHAEAEASSLEDIGRSLQENLDLSALSEASTQAQGATAPPPTPVKRTSASLPSFGLGLQRQKSFGHTSSMLADAEIAKQKAKRGRCAMALGRIARRSFRSRPSGA